MPLPADTTLSLLGYSHPGNPVQPKPKLAMIVRMSVETLDALETFPSQPTMDFEFGDVPGIHIGDQFFAMRPLQENMHHELYLRASSATKKTAPLKHYANVVGKFTIERKLDDDVRDKIRESTQDAVHQRTSRHTILIEPPTDIQPKKKKEPHPGMFRKPLRPADKSKTNPLPLPSPHSANKSPATSSSSPLIPLRKRIVHCLAVSERTEGQLLRLVGGPSCSPSSRQEINDLLGELADQIPSGKGQSDKSAKVYRLKPQAWKEVRPYEWPKLTEAERTAMARGARCAFKDLGIPETDSAWTHVVYRTSSATIASSTPSSSSDTLASLPSMDDKTTPQHQEVVKRGVASREIKGKKYKTKLDPKSDILMKDESVNRTSRADHHSSALSRIPSEYGHPSDAISISRKSASSTPHTRDSDQQRRDGNAQQGALPTKTKQIPRNVANSISRTSIPTEKERRTTSQGPKNTQEHLLKSSDSNRPVQNVKSKEKMGVRTGREESDSGVSHPLLKRKIGTRDTDDEHMQPGSRSVQPKRHKLDPPATNTSRTTAQDDKGDASSSRGQPGPGRKREYSVVDNSKHSVSTSDNRGHPPSLSQHAPRRPSAEQILPSQSSLSRPSNTSKLGGTPKNRRAPIYTSSEDEDDESLQQQSKQGALPGASKGTTLSECFASNSTTTARTRIRNNSSRSLPNDHASLRARYSALYLQYLALFQKLVAQKGKIDYLLTNGDMGSAGSITESETDVELLDPDELSRLAADHKKLHEELEAIQRIFGGLCSSD